MKKSKSAYIVIAHGSRDLNANKQFEGFVKNFGKLFPGHKVYGAFLELAKPTIPEALEAACQSGVSEIVIVPMMFFAGRHAMQDIPKLAQEIKAKYPAVDFHFASPLADHPLMAKLMKDKALAAGKKKAKK